MVKKGMSDGGTPSGLRKTLGSLKDTATVNLAKISSAYKEVDIAVVRATNHAERPAKEKHIRAVFSFLSATRPRAYVAYCIDALARRLSKTQNWAVALKTLIVIHRAVREVDRTFQEELINYGRSRGHIFNIVHFKDASSPNAWDYSEWVRCYALYLEERLECFRLLKYDLEADRMRTKDLDTPELLEHLPSLQQLLFRVLGCQPQGAAIHNHVIQQALAMVASESTKIYSGFSQGTINLVDKFFEMKRSDALMALDIYRRAQAQAERLKEFYQVCKILDVERDERYVKIEQSPPSFLQAMEEYVRDVPHLSQVRGYLTDDKSTEMLAIEYKTSPDMNSEIAASPPPLEEAQVEPVKPEVPAVELPDLMDLSDPVSSAPEILDEKKALALAIIPVDFSPQPASTRGNGVTSWELALVTAPSSNHSAAVASGKPVGGPDKLDLDSLYDDAMRRNSQQNMSHNPWDQALMTNSMMPPNTGDPFYAPNAVAAPMGAMKNQQQSFLYYPQQQMTMGQQPTMLMMGQQPMMMMMAQPQQQPMIPFGSTHVTAGRPYGMPVRAYNPYSSLV